MKTTLTFFFLLTLFSFSGFAQKNASTSFEKECRLAGGGGIGGGFGNAKPGTDLWVQMSYRLSKNFSVATEFEYLFYRRPSFYQPVQQSLDDREYFENFASFLIKYHLPIDSKLKFNVASGWSYHIQQLSYTYYESYTGGGFSLSEARYHYSNFGIPFIAEINYPLGKGFQIGLRGKYNLDGNNDGNTYSTAIGVSMKL